MSYALIQNGAVTAYPYSFAQLRAANPQVSFPSDVSDEFLAGYGVIKIATVAKPAYDPTKNIMEGTPTLVGGVWTQTWNQVDATAEEIAERTEAAAQAQEFDAAKLDAWIVQFLAMTPSEAQAFVNNNGATLAAVRTNVARLAYAVRVLVRREFNR